MKKYIHLAGMLFLMAVCAAPLWAQSEGSIRGDCKDQDGKPLANAVVTLYDAGTGRKYTIKCSNGQYSSIGIAIGTYKATLTVNGTAVDEQNGVPIYAGQEQIAPFNLAKNKGAGPTPEQRAAAEAAEKANEKIKNLNGILKQAKELEGQGNWDQAITILQQASQAAPDQDLIWAYLGDAQRGAKKYPDAVDSYQKALAIKPTNGAYMAQMADALAKSGQTDKAIQQYAAAAQADPTNAAAYYYNEGAVLTNTGKFEEAIAAFDKCIAIDPKRADAYYWKGVNLMSKLNGTKLADPQATAAAFNKYLELAPTGKFADATKGLLASINAPADTSYSKKKGK